MKSNRKGREFALQSMYALEMGQNDLEYFQQDVGGVLKVDDRSREFGQKLIKHTVDNIKEIDGIISDFAVNWDLERIAVLDKIILRFTLAEMKYMRETPPKVCLTEAVQLAKKYSDANSPSFVNGILDSVYKKFFLTSEKV
jgi:N utilization substance protein B